MSHNPGAFTFPARTGRFAEAQCDLSRPVLSDAVLQAAFERDGFVVVDLLHADELCMLRDAYWDAAGAPGGVNPPGSYNDTYAEFSVIHSRPDFRRAAFEIMDLVVTGPANRHLVDYRPVVANFVNKPPGRGIVPAHQNWSVVDERAHQSVSVWVALDDVTIENGALWMGAGTHLVLRSIRGMWAYHAYRTIPEDVLARILQPLPVRAGQAVILDDALLHYSPPNRTTEDRLAIQFVMVPSEAESIFGQQVGGDDDLLVVDLWRVQPEFFLDFWHGEGDARFGEVVDQIEVLDGMLDERHLLELIGG